MIPIGKHLHTWKTAYGNLFLIFIQTFSFVFFLYMVDIGYIILIPTCVLSPFYGSHTALNTSCSEVK